MVLMDNKMMVDGCSGGSEVEQCKNGGFSPVGLQPFVGLLVQDCESRNVTFLSWQCSCTCLHLP